MDSNTATLTVIAACIAGIVFFAYMKIFLYSKYRQDHERKLREAAERPEKEALRQATAQQQQDMEQEQRRREQVLFFMHQEQVRRMIDGKMAVLKSVAEAQSKLTATQGEVVRMVAETRFRIAETGHGNLEELGAARADAERNLADLHEQQRVLQAEAERRIGELDAEIRTLPGASAESWVATKTG